MYRDTNKNSTDRKQKITSVNKHETRVVAKDSLSRNNILLSMNLKTFRSKKRERKGLDNFMTSSSYSLMPFFNSIPSSSEN